MSGVSTGDIIAICFGIVVIVRWILDIIRDQRKLDDRKDDGLQQQLTQMKSDLAAHEASDRIEFKYIREGLNRVELAVNSLNSQIRTAVSRGGDHIIHLGEHTNGRDKL
jgi:hypothetical protein